MTTTTPTAQTGDTVAVHYRGTLDDGSEFDNSYERETPLTFTLGSGELIAGFDQAVAGMTPGEKCTITLDPEDAYGDPNAEAVTTIQRDVFPEDLDLTDGSEVPLMAPNGQPVMATVTSSTDEEVTFDVNHPLAGKTLNFAIELVEITPTGTDG